MSLECKLKIQETLETMCKKSCNTTKCVVERGANESLERYETTSTDL